MLMSDQHLYKSYAVDVYGHCRLLLRLLRLPGRFLSNTGLKKLPSWPKDWTTLDLSSQSGAHDLSAMIIMI